MITSATDFDLRPRNTFRIQCHARQWIEFSACDDIPAVASQLSVASGSTLIIGAGSDILFTLPEFPGTVAHSAVMTLDMTPLGNNTVRITAGSGITMDDLVERTCRAGLWGMENLSGIPGEVGASAVQNVGAYGCEAADLIESVTAFDTRLHRFVTLSGSDCRFAYRDSIFKHPDTKGRYIIALVTYLVSSAPSPRLDYGNLAAAFTDTSALTPSDVRRVVMATRDRKLPDPALTGSAGSYFTNPIVATGVYDDVVEKAHAMWGPDTEVPRYILPDGMVKIPAAWLIDRAGLKGVRSGGAGTWPTQPLVIANMSGDCTASDILTLERRISDTVFNLFGIRLGLEVEKAPAEPSL